MSSTNDDQKKIAVTRFEGGISDDIREPAANKFSISKHFDIYSNPGRLSPYRDIVSDNTGQTGIGNLLFTSTSYLLGLGNVSGQVYPQVYFKTGATLITDNWGTIANWVGSGSPPFFEFFIEYMGFFYFWSSTSLVKGDVTFAAGLNESFAGSFATTYRAQGVIHSASNILYFPYCTSLGTFIGTVDTTGTFTHNVLNIPSNFRINSICELGTYLAIGCVDANGGNSKVMLWDLVSEQVTQIIDWGCDALNVLNNVEGALVGVSTTLSNIFSFTTSRITVRRWTGGYATVVEDLIVPASFSVSLFRNVNFVKNNRLYFSAIFGSNIGIFTYGRKSASYNFGVTLDRFATDDNSETGILAALMLGDMFWTVHTAVGTVTRMNDQPSFTATSIYESQKFRDFPLAHLDSITVDYPPLPTSGQIIVKFRKDAATDWTMIFRDTTDNATSHNTLNIESNSDAATISIASPAVVTLTSHNLVSGQAFRFNTTGALPTGITVGTTYYVLPTSLTSGTFRFSATPGGTAVNATGSQSGTHTIDRTDKLPVYKEIQFRIESTGGAEVLGFSFNYSLRKTTYG